MAGHSRPALIVAAFALGILGGCSDASDSSDGSPQPVDAQVDPTATTPVEPTLAPGEEWLYLRLAGTWSPGDTGTRRKVEVDGVRSTHSTTYWVGCEGVPAVAHPATSDISDTPANPDISDTPANPDTPDISDGQLS